MGAWTVLKERYGLTNVFTELVNLPKFTEAYAHEPRHEVFTPFLPQIESFSRRCWLVALFRMLSLR